jgi:type I restriction enzyme S subunit
MEVIMPCEYNKNGNSMFERFGNSHFFLYYALQHTSFINTDVAVPGLNQDYAHSRELVMPDSRTRSLFEEYVAPMHQQIHGLLRYNETLVKARDLLLPRLMNGEIAV